MLVHLALLVVGCGGAWQGAPAPWETRAELEGGPVLLRRRHIEGQAYVGHASTEMVQTHEGVGPDGREVERRSIPSETRAEWLDVILAAPASGPFSVQRRRDARALDAELPGGEPVESSVLSWSSGVARVSDRNELLDDEQPDEPEGPAQTFSFPLLVTLGTDSLIYPERALEAGDRWPQTVEIAARSEGSPPTQHTFELVWTFHGVERDGATELAHVSCEGRWRARMVAEGTDGQRATGEGGGRLACAARIDLRDGHSSSWRLDQEGSGTLDVRTLEGSSRVMMTVQARTLSGIEPTTPEPGS